MGSQVETVLGETIKKGRMSALFLLFIYQVHLALVKYKGD